MSAGADHDQDVQTIVAFVSRLRRVALHPLSLQDDREFLRKLMAVQINATVRSDGTATLRSPLPDEVMFESLATRLRPFTLRSDPTYYATALAALDRLTGLNDPQIAKISVRMRQDWERVTDRTSRTRAYSVITVGGAYTDIELAFAWLYQDAVKSDSSTTGQVGIVERYRAAVGVFSHIALVALQTLDYITQLSELGKIELPDGTFTDPVIVTDTEIVIESRMFEGDVGADVSGLGPNDPLPHGFRPAFDAIHVAHQQQATQAEPE